MRSECVAAMDLGGTNVRLGIVDSRGRVLRRRRVRMARLAAKEELYAWLGGLLADFIAAGREAPRLRCAAVGFAGYGKPQAGTVYYAPNVGGFTDLDLGRQLERRLGLRVVIENDANCAALGEYWRGAGRGSSSLFIFTLGTGVGGGFVVDGKVWHGEDGIAGEVGHTIVMAGGPRCSCGRSGCLEALVSATALIRDYAEAAGGRKAARATTAKAVVALAKAGDRTARAVVERSARALGIGIANVFHLLNPEVILVGGGVSRAGSILLGPAVVEARSLVIPQLRKRLVVKRTVLGDDAGILGAAYVGLGA